MFCLTIFRARSFCLRYFQWCPILPFLFGGSGEGVVDCFTDIINVSFFFFIYLFFKFYFIFKLYIINVSLSYQKNVNMYHWLNDIQCLTEYNIHFTLNIRLGCVIWPMNVWKFYCPKWKWKLLSRVRLFATPWSIQSMEFSRPEYWHG